MNSLRSTLVRRRAKLGMASLVVALVLAATAAFCLPVQSAHAEGEDTFTAQGLVYTVIDDGSSSGVPSATVSGVDSTTTHHVLSSRVTDDESTRYRVTGISENALKDLSGTLYVQTSMSDYLYSLTSVYGLSTSATISLQIDTDITITSTSSYELDGVTYSLSSGMTFTYFELYSDYASVTNKTGSALDLTINTGTASAPEYGKTYSLANDASVAAYDLSADVESLTLQYRVGGGEWVECAFDEYPSAGNNTITLPAGTARDGQLEV